MLVYAVASSKCSWRLKLKSIDRLLALSLGGGIPGASSNFLRQGSRGFAMLVKLPVVFHEKFQSDVASVCSNYYSS